MSNRFLPKSIFSVWTYVRSLPVAVIGILFGAVALAAGVIGWQTLNSNQAPVTIGNGEIYGIGIMVSDADGMFGKGRNLNKLAGLVSTQAAIDTDGNEYTQYFYQGENIRTFLVVNKSAATAVRERFTDDLSQMNWSGSLWFNRDLSEADLEKRLIQLMKESGVSRYLVVDLADLPDNLQFYEK